MRRRRRIGLVDLPRLLVLAILQLASLFGGRYRRTEGAHVLVTDDAGRILAVRTTYLGPAWMLPGGRVERNETPHRAAVRETREETGLAVTADRLLLIDARRRGTVSFIFAGRLIGGELSPQFGEIAEVGWLRRDEIPAASWRLAGLLERIDRIGEGIAYWGLEPETEHR
jgi:ADP-ribose pyrophosphatase YjhB (NUDIX family)